MKSCATNMLHQGYLDNDQTDPANYRPISLTSVFCKLMERIIVDNLLAYLLANNLINKHQHGFLSGKSTETNLLESINDWTISIENKNSQTVAYIDFARAFDSVCHSKLLVKLESYGIKGSVLNCIADFLSHRSHCTRVGQTKSDILNIRSGVVQGSVLGPTLFLLYINDVIDVFTNAVKIKLFADDLKLYTSIKSADDQNNLQNNLNKLAEWADNWQLQISNTKCNIANIGCKAISNNFSYSLNNFKIGVVSEVSDLGVIIDSNLKFSNHINKIVSKAHVRANLILRCFHSRNTASLIKAFTTYARPLLEYCSTVWSPFLIKDITSIESVQRRFTKRLPGYYNLTYPQRLHKLQLESLEMRRLRYDLTLTYKIVFGLIHTDLEDLFVRKSSGINLRGHIHKLYLNSSKAPCRLHFFSNRVINIWNNLPIDTTDFSNITRFKRTLTSVYLLRWCRVNFV